MPADLWLLLERAGCQVGDRLGRFDDTRHVTLPNGDRLQVTAMEA